MILVSQSDSKTLEKGQIVTGRVSEVHPYGIFVEIDEKTVAYIRQRELTLSRNIDPRTIVNIGDVIEGKVIEPAQGYRHAELSVRSLQPDPWPAFTKKFRVGDPVRVKVKRLDLDGVVVEYAPGIDGFIPLQELSTEEGIKEPKDIIWVGDLTEAVIVKPGNSKKRMVLSIRRWVERLSKTGPYLERLYGEEISGQEMIFTKDAELEADIVLKAPILIVDDDHGLRNELVTWLQSATIISRGIGSAQEALELYDEQPWALVLVDLDMPEVDGLSFITQLRVKDPDAPIAVMSGLEMINKHWTQLVELDVAEVFLKPLDYPELKGMFRDLSMGVERRLSIDDNRFYHQGERTILRKGVRRGGDFKSRIRVPLGQLATRLKADKVVVFRLLESRTLTISAEAGNQKLDARRLHLLMKSPVKDVIEEAETISHGKVSAEKSGKFDNLREFMMFESVIGIPLEAGGKIENALFVFSRNSHTFTELDIRDAEVIAGLIEVALESIILEERVIANSRLLLAGQLSSAFSHDVNNRLTDLSLKLKNTARTMSQISSDLDKQGYLENFPKLEKRFNAAVETSSTLASSVREFQQLMRPSSEKLTDINTVVGIAGRQIELMARRMEVSITYDLKKDLPQTMANAIRLQQVFQNLLLNASYHVSLRPEGLRSIHISTNNRQEGDNLFLQIRMKDTGPGIHYSLWETIFELGFTTRDGGSGTGLFVARSFVESHEGTIRVEDSLVQVGTTFLVELPIREPTANFEE